MLKEFVIAAITSIGVVDVDPEVVIADLPEGTYGATHCGTHEDKLSCTIVLGRARIADKRSLEHSRWSPIENTVLHEVCHIKAFAVALERDGTIDKIESHGM